MKKITASLAAFLTLATTFSMARTSAIWAEPSRGSGYKGHNQRPPEPDLIMLQIDWTPGSPPVGDSVHFTAHVKNQGDADTSPWSPVGVRLFIDGTSVGDDHVSNIAPGATEPFDFYWTATAGCHTVRAVADYGDYIPESNEDNNDRQESLTINTPPNTPSNPWPADGATGQGIAVDLSWTGGDPDPGDAATYDVYFEAGDSTPDIRRCSDASSPTCDPGMLEYSTHYYWQVIAEDSHGGSTAGPVWDFTTTAGCQGGWNVDDVDLNGQGNHVEVGPGEAVQVSVNYEVWNPWYGGCTQQIVIGMDDNALYCAYDGVPATCPDATGGSDVDAINAPTQPGTYELFAANEYGTDCDSAMSEYPDLPRRNIGTIVVEEQTNWTFLVYLDGDNNLESAGVDDFLEMASIGSTNDVNIVALFDRAPGYASSYGDWADTRRFHITPGMEPWGANGDSIGEANMGDPQTLIDFVQWGMSNHPAEHYAVVLWDHGSGWRLRSPAKPTLKDVAYDETDGGDALDMPELLSAMDILSNGGSEPLDLVGFDACLMGMIEVDNQLIPYADVRAGSEETEPGDGWPYDAILSTLQGNPTMSANQLGTVIVDEYYASYGNDWTQSAVDLHSPYDTLSAAVDALAGALINGVGSHYVEIATARGSTQEFYFPAYIDLYDFAYQLNQHVSEAAINAAATDVMNAVDAAIIRERHGTDWAGAHGISIYFPQSEGSYDSNYDGAAGWLQFTADTQWDEWLHAFHSTVTCSDPHEPSDAPEESTLISYGAKLSDPDICPAGDVDYYSFVGYAGDTIAVDVDAQATGSALDSYLYLYDTDGTTELTYNDDDDGLDSRILYTLPDDGTYYLKVREYSHPNEGGPTYFYTLSLTRIESFDVDATSTSSPPTIDGQIASGEWDDAATYDITDLRTPRRQAPNNLAVLNLPQGRSWPDEHPWAPSPSRDRLNPVTLYAMRDDSHLYLAMDNPNDTTVNDYDQIGVYFDDNPLPSDGQWTLTSCGNPDGEGNFWVMTDTVTYREWIAGPTSCTPVVPAPGTSGSLDYDSGHTQAEIAIDLTSSALRAAPGDTINMYLWIVNYDTLSFDGIWPIGAVYDDPSTYRPLTLVLPLATPNLSSPSDESNTCDTTPHFDWTSVSGATSYRIQVDNNASFGSPEVDTTVSATHYTPGSGLAPGTYRWRVRAINEYEAGDWSSVWRVTISSAPGAPALSSPLNNETADGNPPTFRWNNVSGATEYRIQVDDDNDFSPPVENETTAQTSYTPGSELDPGTLYYWRVRASNVCGNGPWSGVWRFSTPAPAPPPPIYLPLVIKNH